MIWIATQPVDFRRGMDSLAMLVSEAFGADPLDGGLTSSAPSAEIA
jgi:transposase